MEKKAKGKAYKLVDITKLHANDWNPNELTPEFYEKLKNGISRTLKESGRIPPIIVRPSRQQKGSYEIIDGFHRWKVLADLKQTKIGVFVLRGITDASARILTNTLNYLRGQPNREKYAKGIVELYELGVTSEDLTDLLPEGSDDIQQLLDEADVSIEAFEQIQKENEGNEKEDTSDDGTWVAFKVKISVAQAKVVEQEISRIAKKLSGSNKRGRALEFMAVQSSQTPLPKDIT